ncbi:MAG: hypothetical protein Q9215_004919 [Flavoplaca cf. flavocitrina]
MAGLFSVLEDLDFPRRMLWELMMIEVQSLYDMAEVEKGAFQKVVEKTCTGESTSTKLFSAKRALWRKRDDNQKEEKGISLPKTVPTDYRIVPLKEGDGMEWILVERGLVVPMDWVAYRKVKALEYFELWSMVKEDLDLEKGSLDGSWQYADCRCV